jgi:hypothetical protein
MGSGYGIMGNEILMSTEILSIETQGNVETERIEEMRQAAAVAVALAIESGMRGESGEVKLSRNGHASAWVVQARVIMTNRWPG